MAEMRKWSKGPSRVPESSKSVLIICEGDEDTDYVNKLKGCDVWAKNISVKVVNAAGIDRIITDYSRYFMYDRYDKIVVFCDTEETPHSQFERLRNDIRRFRKLNAKNGKVPLDNIIFYANPCTMQVIIMHFGYELLKTKDKTDYSDTIKKYVPFDETYSASKSQREAIMSKINRENYDGNMKKNIGRLLKERKSTGDYTTNILDLFSVLEGHVPEHMVDFFVT